MDYVALKAEITLDPAGIGYGAVTDSAEFDVTVSELLNKKVRTGISVTLGAGKLLSEIVDTEYLALTAEQKTLINFLASLSEIEIGQGSTGKKLLLSVFGAGSATRSNLNRLTAKILSRAEELGFETVTPSDVAIARKTGA